MNSLGELGEAKAICKFISDGYSIFTQFSGKCPYDIIIEKNSELKRVEVKATQTLSRSGKLWVFQLKKVRSNRSNNNITNFDGSLYDFVAFYIEPEDRLLVFKGNEIKEKASYGIPILENCGV